MRRKAFQHVEIGGLAVKICGHDGLGQAVFSGGLGEFFDIDPTWIRLLFVLFLLAGGTALIVYLIMWLVVPEAPCDN